MTEGTKSYLIGCHSFFMHPLFVLIAWIKEYKTWPEFWELVCIFLHDIGHIGKQYLSDPKEKAKHWKLGAKIAKKLFGEKGFLLIAGHTNKSGYPKSKLYIPDKRSWLEAPNWWLWCNYFIELRIESAKPHIWKKLVEKNLKQGCPEGNHDIYVRVKNLTQNELFKK